MVSPIVIYLEIISILGLLITSYAIYILRKAYNVTKYPQLQQMVYLFFMPLVIRHLSNIISYAMQYQGSIGSIQIIDIQRVLMSTVAATLFIPAVSFYFILGQSLNRATKPNLYRPKLDTIIIIIVVSIATGTLLQMAKINFSEGLYKFEQEITLNHIILAITMIYVYFATLGILLIQKKTLLHQKKRRLMNILLIGHISYIMSFFVTIVETLPGPSILEQLQIDLLLVIVSSLIFAKVLQEDTQITIPNNNETIQYIYLQNNTNGTTHMYHFNGYEDDLNIRHLPQITLLLEAQLDQKSKMIVLDGIIAQTIRREHLMTVIVSRERHKDYELAGNYLLDTILEQGISLDDEQILYPIMHRAFEFSI